MKGTVYADAGSIGGLNINTKTFSLEDYSMSNAEYDGYVETWKADSIEYVKIRKGASCKLTFSAEFSGFENREDREDIAN
jgi:predicted nucleic acid binding AN1-type Zn finger protein